VAALAETPVTATRPSGLARKRSIEIRIAVKQRLAGGDQSQPTMICAVVWCGFADVQSARPTTAGVLDHPAWSPVSPRCASSITPADGREVFRRAQGEEPGEDGGHGGTTSSLD